MSERIERTYTLDQVVEIMDVSARATKIREEKIAKLSARLSEIEKPGHVVLPVEDVRQAVEALEAALEWAVKYPLQGKASSSDMDASERVGILSEDSLETLRKHLEGQSR
jgi:hypothetical protein